MKYIITFILLIAIAISGYFLSQKSPYQIIKTSELIKLQSQIKTLKSQLDLLKESQSTIENSSLNNDWQIIPGERVGPIRASWSVDDILQYFGSKNVSLEKLIVGEGRTQDGIVIFPDTNKELLVYLNEKDRKVDYIIITSLNTQWQTNYGNLMWKSIEEIEKINGKPFILNNFTKNHTGQVQSWENGQLSEKIVLGFQETKKISSKTQQELFKNNQLISNNSSVRAMDPRVNSMHIYFTQ